MATCEGDFQKELLNDLHHEKIRAFHISERFKSGVLDLYIKPKMYPVVWLELKFITSVKQQVALTPLQRKFIKDEQENGGCAGWCVCVELDRGQRWDMYCGTNHDVSHVSESNFVCRRHRGETWDVRRMLINVINHESVWRDLGTT